MGWLKLFWILFIVCEAHSACSLSRGVWGHAPPGKFLKIGAFILNLKTILANDTSYTVVTIITYVLRFHTI